MSGFLSPAILGQVVPDNTNEVIVKIINQQQIPTIKIVCMPGPAGVVDSLSNVIFENGLVYYPLTNTLTIEKIDGGTI
jgi:hypothetical protein